MGLFSTLPLHIIMFEAKSSKFGSIPNSSWMPPWAVALRCSWLLLGLVGWEGWFWGGVGLG